MSRKYHKSVFDTVKVFLVMAGNDYDKMITIADENKEINPPQRFMAKDVQGKKYKDLPLSSLEFVYFVVESCDMDLKYRMIAKCWLYKRLSENKDLFMEEFGEFYDSPEDAMDDFIGEELIIANCYLAKLKKPLMVNKIKGKYNEWKERVGYSEVDERGEKDIAGVQVETRPKNDESSDTNDEPEDWGTSE